MSSENDLTLDKSKTCLFDKYLSHILLLVPANASHWDKANASHWDKASFLLCNQNVTQTSPGLYLSTEPDF